MGLHTEAARLGDPYGWGRLPGQGLRLPLGSPPWSQRLCRDVLVPRRQTLAWRAVNCQRRREITQLTSSPESAWLQSLFWTSIFGPQPISSKKSSNMTN